MRHCLKLGLLACVAVSLGAIAIAAPGEDVVENEAWREILRVHEYFLGRFPDVPLDRYSEGAAAVESVPEDPGPKVSTAPKTVGVENLYVNCLPENRRANFPRIDEASSSVVTLRQAINDCRTQAGEPRLDDSDPALDRIEAAFAQKAAGRKLEIPVPAVGSNAQTWFDKGRFLFTAKRGQRNLSCTNCHEQYAGSRYEDSVISASLSHALRFPAYSTTQKEWISLHDQYAVCSERVGAKPYAAQSDEYKALEYYQSVIASGIPLATRASIE